MTDGVAPRNPASRLDPDATQRRLADHEDPDGGRIDRRVAVWASKRVSPALISGSPARQRLILIVVFLATLTGAAGAALGASGGHAFGAAAYVASALVAVFVPAAIAIQVVGGQVLVGTLLLGQAGPAPLLLLPLVAAIVVTAELLAVVARLNTPLERDPRDDLRRAAASAAIGAGVFGMVVLAGVLPGPTGLVGIALASAACIALAILLAGRAR